MNAHKFVAEKGIDEAKRVLEGAHWENIAYSNGHYYSQSCSENDVNLEELKQVVKSLDTIDRLFGPDQAKHTMKIAKEIGYTSDYEQIKQAIADYKLVESHKQVKCEVSFGIALQSNQSIGAKCEVLDMVDVSPRCEVINETH